MEQWTHARQTGADESNVYLNRRPQHKVPQIVRDISVVGSDRHDNGQSDDGHDADEEAECKHARQDQPSSEGDVESKDRGERHAHEDKVDDDVGEGASEVDGLLFHAFSMLDQDVPLLLDGVTRKRRDKDLTG